MKTKGMNLTGQRFGRLVVLREVENHISPSGTKYRQWECQCDCGNKVNVLQTSLRKGATKSCGCLQDVFKETDLTGQRIGQLTVMSKTDAAPLSGNTIWKCTCDCGNIKSYTTKILLSGKVCSCGCVRKENGHKRVEENAFGIYKDTCITRIKSETPGKNNKSGVTGVHKASDSNSWIAEIRVQKRHIYLGSYSDIEDAIKARKEAEKMYFKPLIEEYEKGSERDE